MKRVYPKRRSILRKKIKDQLMAGPSVIAGTGCYAGRDFRKGEVVGEYTGEIIENEEADDRYEGIDMTYLFEINEELCIDALHDPNPVKFINHSCEPNCESVQKGRRVFIKAIKPIKKGEELTYDYCLQTEDDDDDPLTCTCGNKNCRGTMREKPLKKAKR